jgi:hypothetical protein
MEEQAKALAAEQGLAGSSPRSILCQPRPRRGLVRLSAEPAPLTEAELARLEALDASWDEHAAILEDEDSAEEAVPRPKPRSKRSSANARSFATALCWRPSSRPRRA